MKKIILDLCGGTGSWSKPYLEAGYDVRNITLPEYDVLTYKPPEDVYGILAAPPCTMFSFARTRAKTPRDFRSAMEVVKACLNVIWECRINNKLKFWALENPMDYLRQFLGKPYFTFDPWQFGDLYTKKTDLWGYFTKPRIKYKNINDIIPSVTEQNKLKQNIRKLPSISEITSSTQADRRAVTPQGFANAFFKANK